MLISGGDEVNGEMDEDEKGVAKVSAERRESIKLPSLAAAARPAVSA